MTATPVPSATKVRTMRRKAETTADALAEVMDAFPGAFDGPTRDAVGELRYLLLCIAEGDFYPAGIQ